MSLRAMLWALEEAPVDSPAEALVLVALADHTNDDGTGAWPSVASIAKRARISERSVQRILRALLGRGVIRLGDQAKVSTYTPNRRPTVYDLAVGLRGANLSPQALAVTAQPAAEPAGVSSVQSWGDSDDSPGVTAVAPKPSLETKDLNQTQPPVVPQAEQAASADADGPSAEVVLLRPEPPQVPDPFQRFWALYPRKVGKQAARKAWDKALKGGATVQAILDGVTRYAEDPNREPRFTAHPTTWLHQGRWEDETPLPPRSGKPSPDWHALAAEIDPWESR